MSRKRTAGTLTGGTKDVNPQTLGFIQVMSAANIFTQQTVALPVNRTLSGPGNMAQVIEVLWVEWSFTGAELFNAAAESLTMQLTTTNKTALVSISDPDIIALTSREFYALVTSGGGVGDMITHIDMTDGAGHGLLVATPNIFFGVGSTGLAAAATGAARIAYRFKNVGLQEYIGMAIQFGGT